MIVFYRLSVGYTTMHNTPSLLHILWLSQLRAVRSCGRCEGAIAGAVCEVQRVSAVPQQPACAANHHARGGAAWHLQGIHRHGVLLRAVFSYIFLTLRRGAANANMFSPPAAVSAVQLPTAYGVNGSCQFFIYSFIFR